MSKPVLEEAAKRLEAGDSIQKTYLGTYNGKYGSLSLSSRKVLFIAEEGLFRKTAHTLLELPLKDVREHSSVGRNTLRITDSQGKLHEFVSDIPVSFVMDNLSKLLGRNRQIPA